MKAERGEKGRGRKDGQVDGCMSTWVHGRKEP